MKPERAVLVFLAGWLFGWFLNFYMADRLEERGPSATLGWVPLTRKEEA